MRNSPLMRTRAFTATLAERKQSSSVLLKWTGSPNPPHNEAELLPARATFIGPQGPPYRTFSAWCAALRGQQTPAAPRQGVGQASPPLLTAPCVSATRTAPLTPGCCLLARKRNLLSVQSEVSGLKNRFRKLRQPYQVFSNKQPEILAQLISWAAEALPEFIPFLIFDKTNKSTWRLVTLSITTSVVCKKHHR